MTSIPSSKKSIIFLTSGTFTECASWSKFTFSSSKFRCRNHLHRFRNFLNVLHTLQAVGDCRRWQIQIVVRICVFNNPLKKITVLLSLRVAISLTGCLSKKITTRYFRQYPSYVHSKTITILTRPEGPPNGHYKATQTFSLTSWKTTKLRMREDFPSDLAVNRLVLFLES